MRRLQVSENKDMTMGMIEGLLFEDDRRTGDFLKTLISANGLHIAWDALQKRVQSCEDLCVEMVRKTSPSALKEEFVTRGEYADKVDGQHSADLKNHQERIQRQEADREKQHMLNEDSTHRIHDHRARLTVQEQALPMVRQELSRIEAQDLQRHEAVLGMHGKAVTEQAKQMDKLQKELSGLGAHVRNEEKSRLALAEEVSTLKDFLHGEQLNEHIKTITRLILADFSRKDELHAEAKAAVDTILKPVLVDHQRLKKEISNTNSKNEERYETIEESLKKAHHRISEDARESSHRIEEINVRVDACATKKSVNEKEAALLKQVNTNTSSIREARKITGLKFEELVNRMLEFQNILEDHEHALQHQAEELLNRTTKYDLMLCEQRIDDCALRDKVDGEITELRNMAQWQSLKLEKLGVHQSFGGRRKAFLLGGPAGSVSKSESKTDDGSAPDLESSERGISKEPKEEGQQAEERTVSNEDSVQAEDSLPDRPRARSPRHSGMFHDTRFDSGLSPTEFVGLLREQLERLAQGVLGVSHMVFHDVSQPVSTREERQLREAEMIHHLSCICDWVAHKKAPADWDKMKFTSLVMSTSVPRDTERRRTPLHSIHRSPGMSQSTAVTSQSSVWSSTLAQASPFFSSRSTTASPRSPRRFRAAMPQVPASDAESQSSHSASDQLSAAAAPEALRVGSAPSASSRPASSGQPLAAPGPAARELHEAPSSFSAPSGLYAQAAKPTKGPSRAPRMGGGFSGRLSKTRVSIAGHGDGEASDARASGVHLEVLPRLVAALEEIDEGGSGSAAPSNASRK